jgi:TolB-like protein
LDLAIGDLSQDAFVALDISDTNQEGKSMSLVSCQRRTCPGFVALVALVLAGPALAQPQPPRTNVAVFNFQMKSQTSDWAWLEKGLADQITTDFIRGGGGITVLARDDMQSAADKVKWTPELLSDERGMVELRKSLTIEKLVTGVYTVQGEQITITAQVVQFSTREVKDREEVTGKAADVLELQRQLSAKLVGYFTGKPADRVLPELPLWTKSIPATKALYEGMSLYDQGRYGEAWLKFRQASRDDGDYLEAQYWVGKMYYFMDRYEHARKAFERFVYMDQSHPRIGDAIKEYLQTYEKLDAPLEVLLQLYQDFEKRYPNAGIYGELGGRGPIPNRVWLWVRQVQAMGLMGRLGESIALGGKACQQLSPPQYFYANALAGRIGWVYMQLTGKLGVAPGLEKHRFQNWTLFQEGQTEAQIPAGGAFGMCAPEGYIFKKLRFYPISAGGQGSIRVQLQSFIIADCVPDGNLVGGPDNEVKDRGIAFSRLPRTGLLRGTVDGGSGGLRVAAEFEKLGPCGAIFPNCTNTLYPRVEVVEANTTSIGPVIGLLPPRDYTVRFLPYFTDHPYAPCERKVNVKAGQTTIVNVTLPWAAGSPWSAWQFCPTDVVPSQVGLQYGGNTAPIFQMDDKSIRFLQVSRGDIWVSVSTDGNNFSRPSLLPMPVCTGWVECEPVCIRDESGRFLLAFLSDRGGGREARAYVCWSRDFVHWSAPAMVLDGRVQYLNLMQDDKGRFVLAHSVGAKVVMEQSRDAYRWEKLGEVTVDGDVKGIKILQRADGRYELFVAHLGSQGGCLDRYLSKDGADWEAAGRLSRGHGVRLEVSAMHVNGRSIAAVDIAFGKLRPYQEYTQFCREKPDGTWEESPPIPGLAAGDAATAYHPRWGYYIGSNDENGVSMVPGCPSGNSRMILHGPSLEDGVFKPAATGPPPAASQPGAAPIASPAAAKRKE